MENRIQSTLNYEGSGIHKSTISREFKRNLVFVRIKRGSWQCQPLSTLADHIVHCVSDGGVCLRDSSPSQRSASQALHDLNAQAKKLKLEELPPRAERHYFVWSSSQQRMYWFRQQTDGSGEYEVHGMFNKSMYRDAATQINNAKRKLCFTRVESAPSAGDPSSTVTLRPVAVRIFDGAGVGASSSSSSSAAHESKETSPKP